MRAIWMAVLAAGLAACSSSPTQEQSPAGVEERTPGAAQPQAQTQATKPGAIADRKSTRLNSSH